MGDEVGFVRLSDLEYEACMPETKMPRHSFS